jgi:hypothetical protein
MNEPVKPAASTSAANVDESAPSVTPSQTAALEHASALLRALGPVDALRVLGAMSEATAKHLHAHDGDPALRRVWDSSSAGMIKLASSLSAAPAVDAAVDKASDAEDEGEGEEESEDEDNAEDGETEEESEEEEKGSATSAPTPRRERAKMRRRVAGMFEVTARVDMCRLRKVVNEMDSGRGELVGRANDQGIEQTEWPLAAMTSEWLHELTRPRGGTYMFEWFGRDVSGARVALGRSRTFKVQGDAPKALAEAPVAPPATAPAPMHEMFTCFLEFQRRSDERADRERERNDREKVRELELLKHRETLASKERLERMNHQTRLAELRAEAEAEAASNAVDDVPPMRLNETAITAYIQKTVAEQFAQGAPATNPGDDLGIPKWLQALGLNREMLPVLREQVMTRLPTILSLSKLKPTESGAAPDGGSPYGDAPNNVARFVPKGGTGTGTTG